MRGEDNDDDQLRLRCATMLQLQRLLEEKDAYKLVVLLHKIDTAQQYMDIYNLAEYAKVMVKKGQFAQKGDAVCTSVFLERTIIIVSDNLDDARNVIGECADVYNPNCDGTVDFFLEF